jgi:acetyl-CoA acyltransferase 2
LNVLKTYISQHKRSLAYSNISEKDAAYLARHIGLRAGLKIETPALTINRLCGSGFQSIINGVQDIVTGDAQVVLTGGTENMTMAPYALRGVRGGTRYGVELSLFVSVCFCFCGF